MSMPNFKEKPCKLCGELFKPTKSGQFYCGKMRIKKCVICGKEMEVACGQPYMVTNCCSDKCKHDYTYSQRDKKSLSEVKICKWCGKEFRSKSKRAVYCEGPHYKTCVICGKEFEVDVRKDQAVMTCSKECKYKYAAQQHDFVKGAETTRQHLQEKYGVDNVVQIPGVIDKIKKTNLERYGSEWYQQTQEYKDKVKESCLEKYGVEHHLQAQEVIDKRTVTVQEKYGVENVFQSEEIKSKSTQTNLEKYGVEHASASPEIIEQVKKRNIEKYGVIHPMMLSEFKDKAVQTNIEKYGRRAYNQKHIEDLEEWYEFIDDPESFIKEHFDYNPSAFELARYFKVDATTIYVYLSRNPDLECIRHAMSFMEEEVKAFLKSVDSDLTIQSRNRTEISPYELDIYLPDYNLAIECDPTATHNSSIPDPWGSDPKSHGYHKMKTDMCESKGIFLFHIFGYDWIHKTDVIKSMLRNCIKKNKEIVYARKCNIVEVSSQDAFNFLQTNHRQGNANSAIRIGLEYKGKLVSLMTFGKMRGTIGTGKENLDDCYELVRFCNLLNTTVVGGASKLFKHFIKMQNPVRIRSFSDRAHTLGTLYSKLGFTNLRVSDPGYVWVELKTDRDYHRYNAQKQNIKKFLNDDTIDLSKSEREIMIEHGFVQVFDSGTVLWEWRNPEFSKEKNNEET